MASSQVTTSLIAELMVQASLLLNCSEGARFGVNIVISLLLLLHPSVKHASIATGNVRWSMGSVPSSTGTVWTGAIGVVPHTTVPSKPSLLHNGGLLFQTRLAASGVAVPGRHRQGG